MCGLLVLGGAVAGCSASSEPAALDNGSYTYMSAGPVEVTVADLRVVDNQVNGSFHVLVGPGLSSNRKVDSILCEMSGTLSGRQIQFTLRLVTASGPRDNWCTASPQGTLSTSMFSYGANEDLPVTLMRASDDKVAKVEAERLWDWSMQRPG